jgi:hypothetical protein
MSLKFLQDAIISGSLTVTSGTSGDATLIISADTDNSEEADSPRLWFKADGDITEGAIQHNDNTFDFISNVSSSGGFRFLTGTTNNTGTTDPSTGATQMMSLDANGLLTLGSASYTGGGLYVTGSASDNTYDVFVGKRKYPRIRLIDDAAVGDTEFSIWNLGDELRFGTDAGSSPNASLIIEEGAAALVKVNGQFETGGDTIIGGHLDVTSSSASGSPLIRFNQTTTRRGFIQMADTNNNLRVASEYGSVSLEAASSEGADSDTSYIRIQPGGTVEIGAVDGDATIATDGNMTFRIDADNDETSQKFAFQNNASTEVASLSERGDLSLDGVIELGNASDTTIARSAAGTVTIEGAEVVTHKKFKQIYFQNFVDDLGTTKHYLPWKGENEQTVNYQEEAAMVAVADGRIVSVTIRLGSLTSGSGNLTIGIETGAAGVSYANPWTVQETETIAITNTDDHHVAHFAFDNAKHFDSTDLVAISIQSDVDLHSAAQFWYVSTVVEYDYTTFLGETSAEFDTTP